ncbi:hypothetical protein PsAD46_01370 [Pseudovibrio sp. Ad46]|nr:hypothetical protein PsAD46_01370 [Pseudovibrio sp. Ad46]
MIIKAQRVSTKRGVRGLIHHLWHGEENEEVSFLQGSRDDVLDMHCDAKQVASQYCVRHWVIAPREETSENQFHWLLHQLAREFCFSPSAAVVVKHGKPRAVTSAFDEHWHVLVSEVDPVSGKILPTSWDYVQHELLARWAEVEFGHEVVPGKHLKAVIKGLAERGLNDVANKLKTLTKSQQTTDLEAFSTQQHQEKKRKGIDLPQVRARLKSIWEECTNTDQLQQALASVGLKVALGAKKNTWIVETEAGELVGSLSRLLGQRISAIREFMERENEPEPTVDPRNGLQRNESAARRTSCTADATRTEPSYQPRSEPSDGRVRQDPAKASGRNANGQSRAGTGSHRTQAAQIKLDPSATNHIAGALVMLEEELTALHVEANTIALSAYQRVSQHLCRLGGEETLISKMNYVSPVYPQELLQANDEQLTLEAQVGVIDEKVEQVKAEIQQLPTPRWWWIFTSKHEELERKREILEMNLQKRIVERSSVKSSLQKAALELCNLEQDFDLQVSNERQEFNRRKCLAQERIPVLRAALRCLESDLSQAHAGPDFLLRKGRERLENEKTRQMQLEVERTIALDEVAPSFS